MKTLPYDVAILGGGAAGMVAAIQASMGGARVVILEVNEALGKKILATGNGKCNYTNLNIDDESYYGDKDFIKQAFSVISNMDTLAFFESLGIEPLVRDGLVYPRSQQASSILNVLLLKIKDLGITVLTEFKVQKVQKEEEFCISSSKDKIYAKRVILAMGGKASSIKGSNGDGYYYAKQFGHEIKPVLPALVQLHSSNPYLSKMAGTRNDSRVSIYVEDSFVRAEQGELQITDYGISGILVFQISRIASLALEEQKKVHVFIDFLPEISETDLSEKLTKRFNNDQRTVSQAFVGLLPEKIIQGILESVGISENQKASMLTFDNIEMIKKAIKEFELVITDTHGFKNAQVTAGGIATDDICPTTMESKHMPGFYVAGEIMDIDGICGGYNLQWAWTSGMIAGINAAKECYDKN